jgi:ribonuclease D
VPTERGATPRATSWIRTAEALHALARSLAGSRAIALDSESDSLYHHFDKVCLVQIASEGGEAWLVDTLLVRDLGPLAPLMADASVCKVFHGADYDVTTMKRDFGFAFASIFDTMIAARFLGYPEIGLRSVAQRELSVALTKDSQKDDWSRRPLSPQQEDYALADVRHLLALHETLAAKLREKGRLAWAEEECAAVAQLEPARRRQDPLAYQKVKGARRLAPAGLAVLRELFAWREGKAEALDRPAFKIVGNEVLLALAEAPPHTREDLGRIRIFPRRLLEESEPVLEAVARARALPPGALPSIPREPRPVVSEAQRARDDALKAWRKAEAGRAELDPSVILPQRLIDRLVEDPPRAPRDLERVTGLRRWRIEAYGAALVQTLKGL